MQLRALSIQQPRSSAQMAAGVTPFATSLGPAGAKLACLSCEMIASVSARGDFVCSNTRLQTALLPRLCVATTRSP